MIHDVREKPGCVTHSQENELRIALNDMRNDPSLFSDLEGSGPVGEFEKFFTEVCGTNYAVALSSGTAAIHAGLLALGVGPGDEIIIPPWTWGQSAAPILFTGATVVFADIDPATGHLAPESVAERITERTKAILGPCLYGHMADLAFLGLLAQGENIALISDSAHALGAELHGIPAGAWGDAACFSLGRGKLVSSGEGGVLATNDQSIYERAVAVTQHPQRLWRLTGEQGNGLGLNYRLHPLTALLARADLENMDTKMAHRQAVKDAFMKGLGETPLLMALDTISGESPVAYGLPLTWHGGGMARNELCARAQEMGIPLRPGPIGIPLHLRVSRCQYPKPAKHWTHEPGSCPVAEKRCFEQELWVMSPLEMDGMDSEESFVMGATIKKLIASQSKAA